MLSKILVVDDEPDLQSLICQKFRKKIIQKEFEFLFVSNGIEALEAIKNETDIDLILTDINMPKMDGITLLKKLSEKPNKTIKTVIISAYGDLKTIRTAMNLGAFDFLTKPLDLHDLEITLNKTLKAVQEEKEAQKQKKLAEQAHAELLEQQALRKSEKRFRALIENSVDLIMILNPDGKMIYSSPSVQRFLDNFNQNNFNISIFNIIHANDRQLIKHILQKTVENPEEKQYVNELKIINKREESQIFEAVFTNLILDDNITGIIVNCHNITERKIAEEKLIYDAFHDSLTKLPNRALFMDRLSHAFSRYKRYNQYQFAVIFIDLDRFKIVNDSLGHLAGDQLIIEVANRLTKDMHYNDTVARMGGDEFAILLEYIKSQDNAKYIAQRIQKLLQLSFKINNQEVYTSASIGIAFPHQDYQNPTDILRDADTAMYRAKTLGKARHEVFNPSMYADNLAQLKLEMDLRQALKFSELELYYQPIILLETGLLCGFEALLRWKHPQRGIISPNEFIPIAEETGLIVPIGWWTLEQACKQTYDWQKQFSLQPLTISVNLSGKQFSQAQLVEQIDEILSYTCLDYHSLRLEITETTIMENDKIVMEILSKLKGMNIQLNIDDFGTGYSSLSRLRNFPIDTLKIDRSFVMRMDSEPENLEITKAIISMAKSLEIDVIAEGVETATQLALLRKLKCQYGQGYFFSRPVNSSQATNLIAAAKIW
ncbi:EAL domain-containing protein [Okeania sp. KiyG1]|uniref:EAL domain-containing protein n=1 Tax=Okeania sp. KiyG1 TaxID=2720165 RepID=UPI001924FD32|nr:EAL domain-containing protein [Okeania sp. KiyG1]GGA51432.1 two-component system response regulator [Okeania sp. KiyG1]